MSKYIIEYQINIPKKWNGGTWYYCHKDIEREVKWTISQSQAIRIQRHNEKKTSPRNTSNIQGGDKKKSNTLNISSALSSVIASDVEENE